MTAKTGLDALLTPERSVLLLIDHEAFQCSNVHSHEPTLIVNNVVGFAKAAKAFKVPTILTTVTEERGGYLLKGIQNVFPTQKPINRTSLNSWEDQRVVEAVKKTGRKQLIIAALWTENCLAMPVIQSLADGYDVFFVTDASGGVSREAHDMAGFRVGEGGGATHTSGVGLSGGGRARGLRAMEEFQEVKTQFRLVAPAPVDRPQPVEERPSPHRPTLTGG